MRTTLQVICCGERPVAVVLEDGRAVISGDLEATELRIVQAMCVFALDITSGDRPGPYRDAEAERYARSVLRLERDRPRRFLSE